MHIIEQSDWEHSTFTEKLAIWMVHDIMWMLTPEQKISVLLTVLTPVLAQEVGEEEIDTVLDMIKRNITRH